MSEEATRVRGTRVYVMDSITLAGTEASTNVIVCGSHAGLNVAKFAAASGAKAAIFNDAGVGKESAGIAGLVALERYGVAAAAVHFMSARIGDGWDTYRAGRISFVNRFAREAEVEIGSPAADAARRLAAWSGNEGEPRPPSPREESPIVVKESTPRILAFDSVSQVVEPFIGVIAVTGSHGGMVAGHAVKVSVAGAFFNDAGVGKEQAGLGRLPTLQKQHTPGATVSYLSARIGDGLDTYENGVVSHANSEAEMQGIKRGQSVREAADILVAARSRVIRSPRDQATA